MIYISSLHSSIGPSHVNLSTLLAADVLAEGLTSFADLVRTPLPPGTAARLVVVAGQRPVLYVKDTASPLDQCRVIMEAVLALAADDIDAAPTARQVSRRLRSVG